MSIVRRCLAMKEKVLIVDDAVFIRKMIADMLEKAGFDNLFEADTGKKALDLFKEENPDLVILDITLPDCDDLCVCHEMKRLNEDIKIIVYSAVTQQLVIDEAKKLGIFRYFTKPADEAEFIGSVKEALNK